MALVPILQEQPRHAASTHHMRHATPTANPPGTPASPSEHPRPTELAAAPFFPPRDAASSSFIRFPLPGSCSALCRAELPEGKRPHAFSLLGQAGLAAPNAAGRSALAG